MKRLLTAFLIALIIMLAGAAINYFVYLKQGILPLAWTMHGGEITLQIGFGWRLSHVYAMGAMDHDTITFQFRPLLFLIQFVLTALLIYLFLLGWSFLSAFRNSGTKK